MTEPPLSREVSRVLDAFPAPIGERLLGIRDLFFATGGRRADRA